MKALILDFGGVLFTFSSKTNNAITPSVFGEIFTCLPWQKYETGKISRALCYERVGVLYNLQAEDIASAMLQAASTLKVNDSLFELVREMKTAQGENIKIVGMSNILKDDFDLLRSSCGEAKQWDVFDDIFLSGVVGMRKPNIAFFENVLQVLNLKADNVVFVDDRKENVKAANVLGIHGLLYDENTELMHSKVRRLLSDPVARGRRYLEAKAGNLRSETSNGQELRENFVQLIILQATGNRNFVNIRPHPGTWNFFIDDPILTTKTYPDDLDTTSYALLTLDLGEANANAVMDETLQYLNEDGIIQVYIDPCRIRIEPSVCVNVLRLFQRYGRRHELTATFEYVQSVLLNREYVNGTRYYLFGDTFLYFLSQLLAATPADPELESALRAPLTEALLERVGMEGNDVCLAMQVITCKVVGVGRGVDLEKLLKRQDIDGGWKNGWVYSYGSSGVLLGNKGLTTALACKAIEDAGRI